MYVTEICKAWCGMVRNGVVPTKLKTRHLTLKQDLHCPIASLTMKVITSSICISSEFRAIEANRGRGHNFCLQKFLTGLGGFVYFIYYIYIIYIIVCQRGGVSIKPPDLKAGMRHGTLTL